MLITIEGVSGAGKTTLTRCLIARLRESEQDVIDLAEVEQISADPAWHLGQLMRAMTTQFADREAALLYTARTAGRVRLACERMADWAIPVVVADRLGLSLSVQLRRAGLDTSTRHALYAMAMSGLPQPVTVLLEVSHHEHVRRLRARGHRPLPEPTFNDQRNLFRSEYDRCQQPRLLVDTSGMDASEVEAAVLNLICPLTAGPATS
ncbi:hypothetical protein Lesp02_04150 [Lentzea sp. NBRC 105346]|uniref:AAA family ATPase n=1 Tax=Lentzea sp. NBRC 105346 TaxID=3032205 RepID=UPI0024A3E343|nr:AAA family ATPase [Lentzea sp. NBRC 105346]GLZ28225.1 hypothetical protein Lesp02_04150 [Lentzea sp. NBRC 105346]